MLRIAMLSRWHVHADDYAKKVRAIDGAEITCVWDEEPERGKQWASELGVEFEPELSRLLARGDVDAVVCDAPTTLHARVLTAAAGAGKHIFTEKVLASTEAECRQIAEAVGKTGVILVVSMPQICSPAVQYAKKLLNEGILGRVSLIRCRNGHNGVSGNWLPERWYDLSKTAGGAMMDLGCHPVYTLAYLCGAPRRVTAVFNRPYGTASDENSALTAEFESGIIGIAETSFVSYRSPFMLEIYGSDGTFLCRGYEVQVAARSFTGIAEGFADPGRNMKGLPSPMEQFVDACANKKDSPAGLGLDTAILMTRILEQAYTANGDMSLIANLR